jgi:hypothetical protein
MRWKEDDETFHLVLILTPKTSWIILGNQDKMLRYQFWIMLDLYRVRS